MVNNVKLSSENVRWHLRTLGVAKTENINSAPRITLVLLPILLILLPTIVIIGNASRKMILSRNGH